MAVTIKTAISIHKTLFEEAESLAKQLNISRSHLFGLAIENFVNNHQNQILLDQINQAYSDEPDHNEKELLSKMRRQHHILVEGEW